MTREELDEQILYFNPAVTFVGTPGGVRLVMYVHGFTGSVSWYVFEGDHCTDAMTYPQARDYFLKAIGEDNE